MLGDSANNLGSLLSGIGTVVLAIIAVGTPYMFSRWRQERREEKMSSISEEALNHLESAIMKTRAWILEAQVFPYSRNSKENIMVYHKASEEDKIKMQKIYREDPYEVNNFCRGFNPIADEFILAKNRAFRLGDSVVDQLFEKLAHIIKILPSRVARLHRDDLINTEKLLLTEFLTDAPDQINEIFISIRHSLCQKLLLKN